MKNLAALVLVALTACAAPKSEAQLQALSGIELEREVASAFAMSSFYSPDYFTRLRMEAFRREPYWDDQFKSAILAGQVRIGMNTAQAKLAWGPPSYVNNTTTIDGVRAQWVYVVSSRYAVYRYLYFENGRLTAVQN